MQKQRIEVKCPRCGSNGYLFKKPYRGVPYYYVYHYDPETRSASYHYVGSGEGMYYEGRYRRLSKLSEREIKYLKVMVFRLMDMYTSEPEDVKKLILDVLNDVYVTIGNFLENVKRHS